MPISLGRTETLLKRAEILRKIPDAEVYEERGRFIKVHLQLGQYTNQGIVIACYNDGSLISHSTFNRTMIGGSPPLEKVWKYLSKEQQKYFMFHFDIFEELK